MKFKIITLTILFISILGVNAQNHKADSTAIAKKSPVYRAEIGYSQMFRYGDYAVTSRYHVPRIGFNVEFPLKHGFGIETGLKYSYVFGNRNQLYAHTDTAQFKYNGHLLDVPVRLTYTLPIFWGLKVFGYAGPNFNIGLAQTQKVTMFQHTQTPAPTTALDYPTAGTFNAYQSELNRFTIQLGAGGGLQWKNYRVKSGYDWGITNVSKSKTYPQNIKGWYVAFEYVF